MTTRPIRLALALCAVALAQVPARAQQPLPPALPWGITGDAAAALLRQDSTMRIAATRAGREIYAMSTTGRQAVAVLARDTLIGVIYFHPENLALRAPDLFTQTVAQAEREHGPPFCRRTDLAVWPLGETVLEIRLRRPRGDGAPGAEVRYTRLGYEGEIASRSAPAASRPAAPSTASAGGRRGPALLGSPVGTAPASEPAAAPVAAADSVVTPAATPAQADSLTAPAGQMVVPAYVQALCR